ncbi:MAG: hypothetical protein WA030_03570 [Candidatus Microsaccharimonas sp.]
MHAGDADIIRQVTYGEDAGNGSVSVEYGVKGQTLKSDIVKTGCVVPSTPPEMLAFTGQALLVQAILAALALLVAGVFMVRRRRDGLTQEE